MANGKKNHQAVKDERMSILDTKVNPDGTKVQVVVVDTTNNTVHVHGANFDPIHEAPQTTSIVDENTGIVTNAQIQDSDEQIQITEQVVETPVDASTNQNQSDIQKETNMSNGNTAQAQATQATEQMKEQINKPAAQKEGTSWFKMFSAAAAGTATVAGVAFGAWELKKRFLG